MSIELLLSVGGGILLSLIGILVSYVRTYLKGKVEHTRSIMLQRYLIIAENMIETTVLHLNQTLVKTTREVRKDGKLTVEDAEHIFESAVVDIRSALGSQIMDILSQHIGNVNQWIEQEIEKYVLIAKNGQYIEPLINNYNTEE
jgi:hypothetical protein